MKRWVHVLLACLAAGRAQDLASVRAAMDRGDLAAAERALPSTNDAQTLQLVGRLGIAFANAQQFDRAEALLTRALAADPANFKALYNLGVMASYAGHPQRAREVLEAALRREPRNVDALYTLAYVDQSLKDWEHALIQLAQAARIAPERADIHKLTAIAASELHAYDDALAAWDRYLKLEPGDDLAYRERGSAAARIGKFDRALPDLQRYAASHPSDPLAHFELGLAEVEHDPEKALAHLTRAIELKSDFAAARSARGGVQYQMGKPEAALPDLELAAKLQPEDPAILDRLGQTYAALDRSADALRTLRKAAELAPTQSKIQLHFGRALADVGQTLESDLVMAKFKLLGPEKPDRVPAGLLDYLGLTPEQRRADYRARIEKAARENPGDPIAQERYRGLDLEDGKTSPAEALAWLDSVPENLHNADFHFVRARLLFATGKAEEAIQELDQAGDSKESLLMRGLAKRSDTLLLEVQNRWPEWYPVWLARGILTGSRSAIDTAVALGARPDGPREVNALLMLRLREW